MRKLLSRAGRPRKLRRITWEFLGLTIQDGDDGHDPLEDARAALLLYRRFSHVLLALILLSALWVTWQVRPHTHAGANHARGGKPRGQTAAARASPSSSSPPSGPRDVPGPGF